MLYNNNNDKTNKATKQSNKRQNLMSIQLGVVVVILEQ